MKKILSLMICIVLLVGTIGFVSAMTEYETEVYNKMGFFAKIRYAVQKGLFLFTSWGQANCCSENPDREKWIRIGTRIDCDDYCSYDKCAFNIWYSNVIYQTGKSPSGDPNWNNWVGEESGEREYFKGTRHEWYYIETYCCPKECETDDHSTKAYVCENGKWDYKSRYDKDEDCKWDTSGVDLCWCADEDDRFYVDRTGGVHCRSSSRDSWCPSCTSHSSSKCYSSDLYWYDSCGNREEKRTECAAGCTTGSSSCKTDSSDGAHSCTSIGGTCDLLICKDGRVILGGPSGATNPAEQDCGTFEICCGDDSDADLSCHGISLPGSSSYCTANCKCGEGEGDCDFNSHCKSGLVCKQSSGTDFCEKEGDCTSHDSKKCYSNDVYWYNSCGVKEDKKTECGSDDYTGSNYCYNNDVYKDKVDKGCSGSSCTSSTVKVKQTECGTLGCEGGVCKTISCQSGADLNGNGEVNREEVGQYINNWLSGQVTRIKLGQSIQEWSSGC